MAKAVITLLALAQFFSCLVSTPVLSIPKDGTCNSSDPDKACEAGLICTEAGFCDVDKSTQTISTAEGTAENDCEIGNELIELVEDIDERMDALEERLDESTRPPTTTVKSSIKDTIFKLKLSLDDRFNNLEARFQHLKGTLSTTTTVTTNGSNDTPMGGIQSSATSVLPVVESSSSTLAGPTIEGNESTTPGSAEHASPSGTEIVTIGETQPQVTGSSIESTSGTPASSTDGNASSPGSAEPASASNTEMVTTIEETQPQVTGSSIELTTGTATSSPDGNPSSPTIASESTTPENAEPASSSSTEIIGETQPQAAGSSPDGNPTSTTTATGATEEGSEATTASQISTETVSSSIGESQTPTSTAAQQTGSSVEEIASGGSTGQLSTEATIIAGASTTKTAAQEVVWSQKQLNELEEDIVKKVDSSITMKLEEYQKNMMAYFEERLKQVEDELQEILKSLS